MSPPLATSGLAVQFYFLRKFCTKKCTIGQCNKFCFVSLLLSKELALWFGLASWVFRIHIPMSPTQMWAVSRLWPGQCKKLFVVSRAPHIHLRIPINTQIENYQISPPLSSPSSALLSDDARGHNGCSIEMDCWIFRHQENKTLSSEQIKHHLISHEGVIYQNFLIFLTSDIIYEPTWGWDLLSCERNKGLMMKRESGNWFLNDAVSELSQIN